MTPTMDSRAVITPRSHAPSPGGIAGAVIGSVLGGSILLLVLGFLYFRFRRKSRISQAEDALPVPKAPDPPHAHTTPESWPGFLSQDRVDPLYSGRPPSIKDERHARTIPTPHADPTSQPSPTSPYGEDWMRSTDVYTHPAVDYDTLPQDINFSLAPRHPTFPSVTTHTTTLALNHASTAPEAANSSYYDTRISMDSDPAQDITPPSRQMSDLYRAQLREAEKHRRSSSIHKRIWNTIARKQSTRTSKETAGDTDGAQSPSTQQQVGGSFIANPSMIKQEPGPESPRDTDWQDLPIATHYVEEPEQILEGAGSFGPRGADSGHEGEQQLSLNYGRYGRQTQDSQYAWFPGRGDSTVRETTEKDPALPSSALRPGSTDGLPLEAQPQHSTEQPRRLKSPDIPEPMDVDPLQPETNGHSPFRPSHSPQLSSPDSFTINPMAILHPATPAEQAALTTYQIKHSASPPAMPPPPPEIITQQPTQEETVDSPVPKGDDFADMYLDLPSDDEHRRSSDSYEYPSTPGQSSTADSSGRTPDTRPTVSPSPFPSIPEQGKLKSDPGVSPHSSKPSPQSGLLICPECGRGFDQIHKLNHHKRYHDRTHKCTYAGCDKKFGTRTHLDRHINDRHLKLKAYHCTEPTCQWFKGGKSFPRKDNWRRHMIKKHGSTPQDFDNMELSFG